MSDLDDKYYYKFRSIVSELNYIAGLVHDKEEGLSYLIKDEEKRKEVRRILVQISKDANYIQSKIHNEFIPEFPNG